MKKFSLESPIIVTGRGGSGTRILSKLLQGSNVFIGNQVNRLGDSLEWVDISRELIFQDISIENGSFDLGWRKRLRDTAMQSLETAEYKGDIPWGLKLPEMMFCLPEMIDAFPQAKVVHLVRHPISLSLRRTHITSRIDHPVGQVVLTRAYKSLNLDLDVQEQDNYLNNAISWVYQLEKVLDYSEASLSEEQYLMVKYEDIISDMGSLLSQLSMFLDVDVKVADDLIIDSGRINQSIPFGTKRDKAWAICGKTAERLSYTRDCLC